MRPYLQELIARMCVVEQSNSSADSVSWHARREAEGLNDRSMISEIVDFLDAKPGKGERQAAYFIIGKLGKNLQDPECASVLLSFISQESDKYALASLLERLADIRKPADMDLKPIFDLLVDQRWLVRYAAIQALNKTCSPEAEARLLELMSASSDSYDLINCHAVLNRIGTSRAIPLLQRGLSSRKRDVKRSAQAAIEAIQARSAANQGVAGRSVQSLPRGNTPKGRR